MPITTNKLNMSKKLRRLHVFGNGHDLFDALEDQACVAWRQVWYFWTQQYLRTLDMCYYRHMKLYLIFFHFSSSFSLWWISIFSKMDRSKRPLQIPKTKTKAISFIGSRVYKYQPIFTISAHNCEMYFKLGIGSRF